jgi:hypothetical protein
MNANLEAKKKVLMRLIDEMGDGLGDRMKPKEEGMSVTKISAIPGEGDIEGDDDMEMMDKPDGDIRELLKEKDGEDDEDLSILDRFKKKYAKD